MNIKERVIATFEHRQPDKTPYAVGFTVPAYEKMVEYYGDANFASQFECCLTGVPTGLKGGWEEVRPDIWRDAYGVEWDRSIDKDIGVVANRLVTPENVEDYVFPEIETREWFDEHYGETVRKNPDAFYVADLGFSLFERAWTLAGMENILMSMAADPDFVHRLLDRILEHNLQIIENWCRYDVDAAYFGDDWGQQTGVMMGAEMWREYIKPRIKEMYGLVKSHGKYVTIHSCGKVDEIFPDLIEAGLDMFNPFQPEVMDVFEMKKLYGDRLTFHGGISTQRTLPYGTPEETKDEVRRLIKEIGKNGGYIAAPAHAIPGDAKAENIAAMFEVLANQ